jgi:hypothetical protein
MNIAIYSQTSYKITFDKKDFVFEQNNTTLKIIPKKMDYFLMEDTLQPALPYTSCNILIPINSKIKDFSTEIKKEIIMKDVVISPCPKVVPTSVQQNTNNEPINPVYSEKIYPKKTVVFSTENRMKGYSFASFTFSPFIYDAISKELSFVSEISIALQTENSLITPNYSTIWS